MTPTETQRKTMIDWDEEVETPQTTLHPPTLSEKLITLSLVPTVLSLRVFMAIYETIEDTLDAFRGKDD